MAYVHTSVNHTSKEYLSNERRYNYTTPKSFLEQINLYRSLLGQKSKLLSNNMERLENGLQKLNSTSAQVQYISIHLKLDKDTVCFSSPRFHAQYPCFFNLNSLKTTVKLNQAACHLKKGLTNVSVL